MPKADSPAQSVLAELGQVLFVREEPDGLRLSGKTPGWLATLWPALGQSGGLLPVADASPFLENFLIDAEECWQKGGAERAKSGPWVEQDASGAEVQLEATAMTVDGHSILLLERLGEAFEAKKSVLQRARETVIAHQRLNSEIQKKQILLHCVADEMTATLANIITSLRLIELEDNGPRTKLLLGLATRATQEQQTLIHRILGVFEDELRSVHGRSALTTTGADGNAVLRRALDAAAPLFVEKGVRLEGPPAPAGTAQVPADAAHLERAVANLLENALERTPAGGAVVVRATEEPEALLWQVEDSGSTIGPDVCANLFVKWDPTNDALPSAALRLHFCRIVAENCGGEIGCASLPAGGNRFWIRLTTSSASA
jgi:signal transduction histidine kinase